MSLADDEIAALSPSAAAACSLIRSGVSLTGIYREHCRVVAELEEAKNENMRLEAHFRELVEVCVIGLERGWELRAERREI